MSGPGGRRRSATPARSTGSPGSSHGSTSATTACPADRSLRRPAASAGRTSYFSQGLCERCHPGGPLHIGSCRGCLAWGVYRAPQLALLELPLVADPLPARHLRLLRPRHPRQRAARLPAVPGAGPHGARTRPRPRPGRSEPARPTAVLRQHGLQAARDPTADAQTRTPADRRHSRSSRVAVGGS